MGEEIGRAPSTVHRIWRAFGLQPHRVETFKLSSDPLFVEKVRDIVGLYLSPPERAVVLTVDDGHRTVYSDMFPLIQRLKIPVTLFIYPSAISNADYAMTWAQLAEMKASGLVDIQSHTFWHPNFNVEKKRLAPAAYEKFTQDQLVKSKAVLEQRLGGKVDLLAWPFGIHDDQLAQWAQAAGYVAAFTIERRPVTRSDKIMALPRFIVTNLDRGDRFVSLLGASK